MLNKFKNSSNLYIVIFTYIVFIISTMMSIGIRTNGTPSIIFDTWMITFHMMYVLIPLSIIVSVIYFIRNRSLKNLIIFASAIFSISWIVVALYAIGKILSNF